MTMNTNWLTRRGVYRWGLSLGVVLLISIVALTLGQQSIFADARALPAAQGTTGSLAIVGGTGADVYDAPDGDVLRSLIAGDTLTAIGRTEDSIWIQVALEANGEPSGWVARGRLVIFDVESLPLVEGDAVAGATKATEAPADEPTAAATPGEGDADAEGADAPTATPRPTQTPTTAPTPTPTPEPTAPPTPTPTATATPAPTTTPRIAAAAGRDAVIAVARSGGATLLTAPGGEPLLLLSTGSSVSAVGRSEANDFVYVTTRDGNEGWVAADELVMFGYESLPLRGAEAGDATGGVGGEATEATNAAQAGGAEAEAAAADGEPADEANDESATIPTNASTDSATASTGSATGAGTFAATALPPIAPRELDAGAVAQAGGVTATVQLTESRLNVRAGPGAGFNVVAKALPRANFIVLGRSANGEWIQVQIENLPDSFGWVAANFVRVSGSLDGVPTTDAATDAPTWNGPALGSTGSTSSATGANSPNATIPAEATSTHAREANDETAQATEQHDDEETASPAAGGQPTELSGKLAIRAADGGIYIYNLATGALDRITSGIDPEIDREGTRVAYVREGGDNGVYITDLATGEEETVYTGGEVLRSPKFSPDGAKVAFSRVFDTSVCFDTPVGCLPTKPPGVPEQAPNYDKIVDDYQKALEDFDRANVPLRVLSRITLADNDYRDLPALYRARAEDWNEGGIVYSSNGIEITADEPDADTHVILEEGRWRDPDWQPGNGAIAIFNKDGSNHSEIYLVNPDGGDLRAITRPVTTLVDALPSNVAPAWSPDGQQIVYLSNRDENNDAGDWRVWVMDADGGNQRPLPLELALDYKFDDAQIVSWGR